MRDGLGSQIREWDGERRGIKVVVLGGPVTRTDRQTDKKKGAAAQPLRSVRERDRKRTGMKGRPRERDLAPP